MAHPSTQGAQRALRNALPFLFGGFGVLAVSLGLFAVWPSFAHMAVGAVGAGVLLIGALHLARARFGGASSLALAAFFWLWLGELLLRLWTLAGGADGSVLVVFRALIAALAMIALATGVRHIWEQGDTWRITRALFVFQVTCVGALFLIGPPAGSSDSPAVLAITWLIFAGPYAHLFLSLRRTARWAARRTSVAEMLVG